MIIFRKFMRLCLLAGVLMGSLLAADPLFAQDKVDLSLSLLPDSYYREVVPGKSTTLFMEVRNNGNTAITNIRFNNAGPEGWTINFRPEGIRHLSAGSSQVVDINVIPDQNSERGDYTITLIAEANETRSAISTVLRVEKSSSFWLWVGIGVAAVVIAGFVIVFLRFGR